MQIFDEARDFGFSPSVLDIGGGFPGMKDDLMDQICQVINAALYTHFSEEKELKVRII